MRSKKAFAVVLSLLVLGLMSVLVLSACGSETEDTSTTAATEAPTTTAPAEETTTSAVATTEGSEAGEWDGTFEGSIPIGAVGTLTGGGAMGGAESVWAYERAISDINAAGGVMIDGKHMQLELKWVDDKSDPTEAAAGMEKLIKAEGVDLILSSQVTPINLAAATVAEKYEVFYQMVFTWRDFAEEQNYKWSSDFFFTPLEVGALAFEAVLTKPEAERPARWGILTKDDADGQGLGQAWQMLAEQYGEEIVSYDAYTPGAKDYSSSILKLKEANADAVVIMGSPADGITIVQQMKEQGYSAKFMMGWVGFWPSEFAKGLGASSDYVCYDAFWSQEFPYPGCEELGESYKAEHGGVDSVSIGLFYANVQVLAEAIERAGSADPAAVRDEVFGGAFKDTMMGDVEYDEKGLAKVVPGAQQWMGGKRNIILPPMDYELQWAVPWDER